MSDEGPSLGEILDAAEKWLFEHPMLIATTLLVALLVVAGSR